MRIKRGREEHSGQQLLPFTADELSAASGAMRIREYVELPFFKMPKNDNERLLNYQHEFKNGNIKALDGMYELGYVVCLKYIKTAARGNKHIRDLCVSVCEEKAHNAITYVVERYLTVDDFVITKSFTAYLYLRIQHELFYRRKVDALVDFVDMSDGNIQNAE